MQITQIDTGRSFGASRIAVLHAPDQAEPGSMAALRRFLQEKGLETEAGFSHGHVLRIGGFTDDAGLKRLLAEEFPAWQKQQGMEASRQVTVDPALHFTPMDYREIHDLPFHLHDFLNRHSSTIAGLAAFSSGTCFLLSGLSKSGPAGEVSLTQAQTFLRRSAAGCFIAAAGLLTLFGIQTAHNRSPQEVLSDLEPTLRRDLPDIDVQALHGGVSRFVGHFQKHPWQANALLNTIGSVSNLFAGAVGPKKDWMFIASNIAGLMPQGVISLVPDSKTQTLLGMDEYLEHQGMHHLGQAVEAAKENKELFRAAHGHGVADWLPEHKMKVAAGFSFLSNAGFSAKGIWDLKKGKGGDRFLLPVLPINLVSCLATANAKPSFSHPLDSVAAPAADWLAQEAAEHPEHAAQLEAKVKVLSELLAVQREIGQAPAELGEAIKARLDIDHGYRLPVEQRVMKEYTAMLKQSPFVLPHLVKDELRLAEAGPALPGRA